MKKILIGLPDDTWNVIENDKKKLGVSYTESIRRYISLGIKNKDINLNEISKHLDKFLKIYTGYISIITTDKNIKILVDDTKTIFDMNNGLALLAKILNIEIIIEIGKRPVMYVNKE